MINNGYNLFKFFKNTKGLNTRDTATGAPVNSSSDLLNVDFDTTGAIRKRRGWTRIADAVGTYCLGAINFRRSSDNTLKAVCIFDDTIYKMDDYDGTLDDITGTVTVTSNKDYFQSLCISRDTVIGTNYYDAPWKYTGTGNAAALSISQFTNAKFCFQFKNRLCFLNTIEGGLNFVNRLRWSNVNTIENYSSQDFTDGCETADGSIITGFGKLDDDVYIFKDSTVNGIKKLYYTGDPTSPFAILNISGMGTISPLSIVPVNIVGMGSGLLYYGMDGKIYFFDGDQSVSISDHIQPTLNSLTSRPKAVVAENFTELNQVWFGYSSTMETRNTHVLVYDYYNNAFLLYNQIPCDIIKVLENTSSKQYLTGMGITGLSGGNGVNQLNTGNADLDFDSYYSYYWTAWLDLEDASSVKKFRWLDIYLSEVGEYNLIVSWSFNLQDGEQFSRSINLNGSAAVFPIVLDVDILSGNSTKILRLPLVGIGKERLVRFKFENNIHDQPFTLYRFDIHAKYMGQKSIV